MATIYRTARLDVPASIAWEVVDRYTRAEVHIFTQCTSERLEGEHRVVTTADGGEIWERNVTVDHDRMRAVYTVPAFPGAEHHQGEMRIVDHGPDGVVLEWITDLLPDELATQLDGVYDALFTDLVAAVNDQRKPPT